LIRILNYEVLFIY